MIKLCLIAVLVVGAGAGCASGSRRYSDLEKEAPTKSETASWDVLDDGASDDQIRLFKEIRDLYVKGSYAETLTKIQTFEKRFPQSGAISRTENIRGLILLARKQYPASIQAFRTSLARSTQEDFSDFVEYNLGSVYYENKQYDAAEQVLRQVRPSSLNIATRVKFHHLRSLVTARLGQNKEAAEEILAGSYFYQQLGPLHRTQVPQAGVLEKHLSLCLSRIQDFSQLEDLYRQYETSPLADYVLFEIGMRAKKSGQAGTAESAFRRIMRDFPNSSLYVDASQQLRGLQGQVVLNPRGVGVLLPMTGKFARAGQDSLIGLLLAFRTFELAEPDTQIQLFVGDAGETPEQAVSALETLVSESKVSAVIGPLLSKGIDQVSKRAVELGVPMIALTQQPGVIGDSIFYSSVSPRDQATEMAHVAIEKLGLKRFVILHPRDRFGDENAQYFFDAVEANGGSILDIESYDPGDTDFRTQVDRILALDSATARQIEVDELEQLRLKDNVTTRTRRTEKYFQVAPVVNFDAIFIPDEVRKVSQIVPTFAYRDVDSVRFLGVSTWNTPELIARAGPLVENALFTDIFFAQSTSPTTAHFVNRFRETVGGAPNSIHALAYDAGSILERVFLTLGNSVSWSSVRDSLSSIAQFPGVTGMIRHENGFLRRDLKILTVDRGKITELSM